ncbi:cupin [Paenibacillus sp. CAA11]|uniref:cupin domain-containing protein n=1 Tax=Paenibacillus sp. CAA11 TaxID=1532905 RepID=UPI000D37F589|nr:cupin domain-containing protein [Paenibacillus sp. CAA11]AWB43548.1 cupin [Paenibacillus sp. CAA11]
MEQKLSPLVKALDMEPHIEGGWFKEMWKSSFKIPEEVLAPKYSGARASASSTYFLLHPGEVSEWHVVLSDELWLYHSGGPLQLTLGGSGEHPEAGEKLILGMDVENGQTPHALVPAGVWQTATPLGDEPVFVTCVVAPAFHYDDFKLVEKK